MAAAKKRSSARNQLRQVAEMLSTNRCIDCHVPLPETLGRSGSRTLRCHLCQLSRVPQAWTLPARDLEMPKKKSKKPTPKKIAKKIAKKKAERPSRFEREDVI